MRTLRDKLGRFVDDRRLKLGEGKERDLAKFQRHSVRRRECQIPRLRARQPDLPSL